jgi:hypothetical protein
MRFRTVPTTRFLVVIPFGALLLVGLSQGALAQTAPPLGSAGGFTVLGGTAVTLTNSAVTGNVGVAGTAFTNTASTIVGGIHVGDAVALQAYGEFLSAYAGLLSVEPAEGCKSLTGTLSNMTLQPGVYCFDAAAAFTGGQLTLDGPPSGVWVFKVGTKGTGALTCTSFSVVMANGGQPCNVYWWVAEAATTTDSNLKGTVLAGAAVTITGGTFDGRALAKAAVTFTDTDATGCSSSASEPPALDTITVGPDLCLHGRGLQNGLKFPISLRFTSAVVHPNAVFFDVCLRPEEIVSITTGPCLVGTVRGDTSSPASLTDGDCCVSGLCIRTNSAIQSAIKAAEKAGEQGRFNVALSWGSGADAESTNFVCAFDVSRGRDAKTENEKEKCKSNNNDKGKEKGQDKGKERN